jgi:hypothetical protein
VRIREFLLAAQSGQVTFVCEPSGATDCSDFTGFVRPQDRSRIHICPVFFDKTLEERRWMMVHECAHLAGALRTPEFYWQYFGPIGAAQCLEQATFTTASDALDNADNYARLIWCLTRQPGIEVTPP